MIIPQIAENLTASDNIVIPTTCPCCGASTKVIQNLNTSTGKMIETLYCENEDCSAKKIGAFEQFVSRDAMNIVGLSTATIETLLNNGLIKNFVDFYTLAERQQEIKNIRENLFEEMLNVHGITLDENTLDGQTREEFLEKTNNYSLLSFMLECKFKYIIHDYLETHQNDIEYMDRMDYLHSKTSELFDLIISHWDGMGDKSYDKIISAIEKSRTTPVPKFIYSLGISGIGKANATLVCESLDYDITKIMTVTYDKLVSIDGFGEVMAKDFVDYFANPKNVAIVNELLKYITLEVPQKASSDKFNGLTFVLSGSLPSGKAELEKFIKDNGGKVSSSVSKKTSYLVAGDGSGSKSDKANALGVKIINEDELKALLS